MKKFNKILSVVLCVVLLVGLILSIAAAAFAAEDDINLVAAELGLENAADFTTHTIGGVTFTGDIGSNEKNPPKYYTGGEAIRFYAGNTLTITPAEGAPIAYVTVNVVDGYTFDKAAIELTNATATGTDGNTTIVTPVDGAAPIVITKGTANNSQLRVVSISVTLAGEGVEAPVIVTNVNVDEHMDASKWTFNGDAAAIENGQLNLGAKDATAAAMLNVASQNVNYKFTMTINEVGDYSSDWWGTELLIVARSSVADGGWCDGAQTGYTLTCWGDMTEWFIGRAGKDDLSEKIVLNINDGKPHNFEFKVVNNADNTTVTVTLIVDGEVKCEFVDDGSVVKEGRPNLYPDAGNLTFRAVNVDISVGKAIPAPSEVTIQEAIAIGGAKEHNVYTEEKYIITGKIVEIQNETYGNMIIEDETGSILVYGLYSADGSVRFDAMETKPQVGDSITVMGALGNYKETPQMKNGWLQSINAEEKPVEPEKPTPAPGTGDFAIVLAVCAMMASAAVIVLVQKKREF